MTTHKIASVVPLLFAASVAAAPAPPTLPQPVARIELAGFSVQPPDVPGWLILARRPVLVALARGLGGDGSIVLQAGIYRAKTVASADDFVSKWKDEEDQANSASRYQVLAHQVTALQWKGAVCARSHAVVRDSAPHTASGKGGTMTVYAETLACEHPDRHTLVAYVTYSLRTRADTPPTDFQSNAEAVLQSAAFSPWIMPTAQEEVLHNEPQSLPGGVVITRLGGAGDDFSRSILCAQDGSCAIFGYTTGTFAKTTEAWITRLGAAGEIQWAEAYGGDNYDTLWHAIPVAGGGYLAVGASASRFQADASFINLQDFTRPLIVRLDAAGRPLWGDSVELSSDISGAEVAQAYPTRDGGFLIAGTYSEGFPASGAQPLPGVWSEAAPGHEKGRQYSYPLLIRLGPDGAPRWVRRYAFGGFSGAAITVTEAISGHLILSGSVYAGKAEDLFVMETDAGGTPLHTVELSAPEQLGANAFATLADSSYLVVGHAIEEQGLHRAFATFFGPDLKFSGGTLYDSADGLRPLGLTQLADGKLCIAGRTENLQSNQVAGVAWLIDGHGADQGELWLAGPGNTEFESAAALHDGSIRLFGDSNAFGGGGYDGILTTWDPAKSPTAAKRLQIAEFKPKVADIEAQASSAGVGVVEPVAAATLDVTRYTATPPTKH